MSYQTHSSNLPHLQSWIDELVELSDSVFHQPATPNTDSIVQCLQRYNAVFKELLRQTNIFSVPLTQMLSKTWAGALELLMFMIKSYHRYVKQTCHLQSQAQNLLTERQRGEAAHKIQKEEFSLERTALRAQIRQLESELESVNLSRDHMQHENKRLRSVIDVYLQSADFNDPVWDIMQTDEEQSKSGETKSSDYEPKSKSTDIHDAEKLQLKTLNKLDIELNEILSNVLKEENRQRLLMKDLIKVVIKDRGLMFDELNEDVSEGDAVEKVDVLLPIMSSVAAGVRSNSTVDTATQSDEKDENGMTLTRREDFQVLDVHQLGVAPLSPSQVYSPGQDLPLLIRKQMTTFPNVLRIPPMVWTCQAILSIYLDKIQMDFERVQKGLPKQDLPRHVYDYFLRTTGLPAAADIQVAQLIRACEAHMRKQPRILLFSNQIGLLRKSDYPTYDVRDTEFVLQLVHSLLKHGELQSESTKTTKKKGMTSAVIKPEILRLSAIAAAQEVFEKLIPDGVEDVVVKVKSMQGTDSGIRHLDVDLYIESLIEPWQAVRTNWEDHARFLFREFSSPYRVLQEATFANDDGQPATDTVLVEIAKQSAEESTRRPLRLFQRDLDKSGGVEMNNSKEPVCELLSKKRFADCINLLVPNMPYKEMELMFDEALDIAHELVLKVLDGMWIRFLDQASNYSTHITGIPVSPATDAEVEAAVPYDISARLPNHRATGTNRPFFVNQRTAQSQWTRPYTPRLFRTQDIEIDVFVQTIIRNDIFSKSPFLEVLNIAPRDLWPNADMFIKQIRERKKREKKNP